MNSEVEARLRFDLLCETIRYLDSRRSSVDDPAPTMTEILESYVKFSTIVFV